MGAPRKNPPKDAVTITEQLAAQGYSIIGIAKHLGVTKGTFKRWCEEDELIQQAFEVGRETERQALHSLIVQSAVMNKPANANAMFLLKARHGYREFDSPNQKVDVAVAVSSVMVVVDHGDDATWAARAAEQQRRLMESSRVPAAPQLEAPEKGSEPSYGPPGWNVEAMPAFELVERSEAPSWKPRA